MATRLAPKVSPIVSSFNLMSIKTTKLLRTYLFSLSTTVPRLLLISCVSFVMSPVHAALCKCNLLMSFSRTSYPPDDCTCRDETLPWRLPRPPELLAPSAADPLRLLPNLKNFFIVLSPDVLQFCSSSYRPLHVRSSAICQQLPRLAAVASTCCVANAQST